MISGGPDLLRMAGYLRGSASEVAIRVRGGSMQPTIPRGAIVRFVFTPAAEVQVGDVVAFVVDDRIVIHRVARHWRRGDPGGQVLCRGDFTLLPDAPVPAPAVLGRVTSVQTAAGWEPVSAAPRHALGLRAASAASLGVLVAMLGVHPPWAATVGARLGSAQLPMRVALEKLAEWRGGAHRRPRIQGRAQP